MFRVVLLFCCLWCANFVWAAEITDIETYKKIFEAQENGQYKEAMELSNTLDDPILMGYVLYQHYFSPNYKTKKKEILDWMENYSDYPIAPDIYALGIQKKIQNLPRPKGIFGGNTHACEHIVRFEPLDLIRFVSFSHIKSRENRKKAQKEMKQFKRYLLRGSTLNAKNLINKKETQKLWGEKVLSNARISLAFVYFLDNRDDLAEQELKKIKKEKVHPFVYWLSGIIYWRQGDTLLSAQNFEQAAEQAEEPSLKSSAYFWAARAYMEQGFYDKVGNLLENAAEYPRYFYSFLATKMLGFNLNHTWQEPIISEEDILEEYDSAALERFYLLDEIGQKKWATEELTKLYLDAEPEVQTFLWHIAKVKGYSDTLKGLTGILEGDKVRFPLPDWQPNNEWQLDKALIYAFVRQESCFNTRAESAVGAMGLMQLMPSTAKELAKSLQCEYNAKKLKTPEYNLALGQTYLKKLLDSSNIQNNLMKLAVAYNAGPGNLNKWEKKMNYKNDPLLFLETIPSRETRSFVERILINYWIYTSLMDQHSESLDQLILGKWPVYQMCTV